MFKCCGKKAVTNKVSQYKMTDTLKNYEEKREIFTKQNPTEKHIMENYHDRDI